MEILTVTGLTHSYDGVCAVADVTFTMNAGERVAIIGPNGAGKTTLLNCLAGSPPPAGGVIHFHGRDITTTATHRRAGMGIARSFQAASVLQGLSVHENAMLAAMGRRRERYRTVRPLRGYREVADEALALLEWAQLKDRRNEAAGTLAYGEQRRLEVALALAGKPSLYLLDEPSAGLTREETRAVADIILGFPRDVGVIVVDHDMDLVFSVAMRVIVMDRGRLVADGSAEEIYNDAIVRRAYLRRTPHGA